MSDWLKRRDIIDRDERDEDNRRIIYMLVEDDSNFLSPFSANHAPVISGETADFLDHNVKHNLNDSGIHLIIASDRIDETEKPVYRQAIANYYHIELKEIWQEMRKNAVVSLIMTLFSAVVFSVAVLLEMKTEVGAVILNMLDVFAWVFLWEAVDMFFLQRPQLRKRRYRTEAVLQAKITFVPSEQ